MIECTANLVCEKSIEAMLDALLRTMLDVVCKYQRTVSG